MPIRTEDQARTDLKRHLGPLNGLFEAAHQEFREHARGLAPTMDISTRAMVYRGLIWKHARAYTDEGKNGAHMHRRSQLLLLGLEGRYLCRVKKLRHGFSVAVSSTVSAETYDGNRLPDYAEDIFPGCEDATLLYLGWAIPENAPDQIDRYLICNNPDRSLAWAIPLGDGRPSGVQKDSLPFGHGPEDAPARIRIKAADAKKANG